MEDGDGRGMPKDAGNDGDAKGGEGARGRGAGGPAKPGDAGRGGVSPLLIGGATTSRQHTAVKIAPAYQEPVVHVVDASRVVGVMSALLDEKRKAALDADNRKDQERLRRLHEEKQKTPLLPYRKALENRLQVEWRQEDAPPPPAKLSTR